MFFSHFESSRYLLTTQQCLLLCYLYLNPTDSWFDCASKHGFILIEACASQSLWYFDHRRKHRGDAGDASPRNHSGGANVIRPPPLILATSDMCCVMNMVAQQAVHKPPLCFRPQSPHTQIFHQFPLVGCHASALRRSLLVFRRDVMACLAAAAAADASSVASGQFTGTNLLPSVLSAPPQTSCAALIASSLAACWLQCHSDLI